MSREATRNSALALALLFLGLIDPYFVWRFNGSPPSLRSVLTGLTALFAPVLIGLVIHQVFGVRGSKSRLLVLAAFTWAFVWAWPTAGIYTFLLLLLAGMLWVADDAWRRMSTALCFISVLFIATPYVFAAVTAKPVSWLTKSSAPTGSKTTVVILFDELSSNATAPLVSELAKTGENVLFKSLKPVGQNTINVIPALFTGDVYSNDRVCGATSLCTGSASFDFSSVVVGRRDVDVAGFYMPYCSIAALRSCTAVPFDRNRNVSCTASRTLSIVAEKLGRSASALCVADLVQDMRRILGATETALWNAPVWDKGGVLYAHLPSPHPVGLRAADRSLNADYESNLQDVSRIAARALARLRASGRPFTLILFSDHPLRRSHCEAPVYAVADCASAKYFDNHVPLIVVGERPVGFDSIESNRDIFSLVN